MQKMNLFFVLSYTLTLLGLLSLLMAGSVDWPMLLLVLLLVSFSPFRENLGLNISRQTINFLVLAVIACILWLSYDHFSYRLLLYLSLTLLVAK